MPNYEYRCFDCRKRFMLFFTYAEYGTKPAVCPYCKGTNVQRKIGRVRVARSDDSRMESLADPSNLSGLEDDPRALGRMMREMSKETGESMGAEFDEVVDRLEKGQSPEDIERELPDLGGMADGGGGMDMGDDF
ncbi:MAG: zinc ribbon domain-containing protein [Anaerolineaceae bacterium]|nr:zinc ribbon domain-containing protein [Anaerolineaceae bacterium]